MGTSTEKSNKNRSISLPSRSHPSTHRIEQELNKLQSWERSGALTTVEICNGLSGFEELHKCMYHCLNLPLTLQVLCQHRSEKWFDELLDSSVRMLDICGLTRDLVSQFKENVRYLRSTLRRRKGDLTIEASIDVYKNFRKKMKIEGKQLIAALKKMDREISCSVSFDVNHHVSAVIRALKEVSAAGISFFQIVLIFLSVPISRPKTTKWSLVTRLVQKGEVSVEDQQGIMNELEFIDTAICSSYSTEADKAKILLDRLEILESQLEVVENGLQRTFRCLMRSRSSLLNVMSMTSRGMHMNSTLQDMHMNFNCT